MTSTANDPTAGIPPIQSRPTLEPQTLKEGLAGSQNALNFVRLALASLVIVGHSWPIGGFGDSAGEEVAAWAVNGFFVISGFLIAGSRVRSAWWPYLWRRALRIFPAFWMCLMVTAFVLAPLAASREGHAWVPESSLSYLVANMTLLIHQPAIDHTLLDVPYPRQWNGSLWTLSYEFLAYLAAGGLLTMAWARRHCAAVIWTTLAMVILGTSFLWIVPLINNPGVMQGLRLAGFFLAGMALWSVADRVRLSAVMATGCAVVIFLLFLAPPVIAWSLAPLPTAYLMLWLGAVLPVRVGSRNDISYGIYVYAFPVQQMLAVFAVHTWAGFWGYAALAWCLTALLAAGSWWGVEKPLMRFKRFVGDRRPAD